MPEIYRPNHKQHVSNFLEHKDCDKKVYYKDRVIIALNKQ